MIPTFDAIVTNYSDSLLRFLVRKTNGDLQLAQDILQETFISIWKQFDKVRWDDNLSALFKSIAYRRLADYYRKYYPPPPCDPSWEDDVRTYLAMRKEFLAGIESKDIKPEKG